MWLLMEIGICLVLSAVVCFWMGKRLGQRRFFKVQDEMRALELSLNQLIDQMELVSGHNLKVMETKTAEMHELLPIIDKKLLYAQDVLSAIDEAKCPPPAIMAARFPANAAHSAPSMPAISSIPSMTSMSLMPSTHSMPGTLQQASGLTSTLVVSPSPPPPPDPQLRRDIDETKTTLAAVTARQVAFEERFARIENRLNILTADLATVRETQVEFARLADLALRDFSDDTSTPETSPLSTPHAANVFEEISLETPIQSPAPSLLLQSEPLPGSPTHEVLEMFKKGVTTPQIARHLKMGHGEVELIMNIFGPKARITTNGKVTCR
ncbi:MAG: hypothetical protein WA705_28370 [Candidatus Ozemobacteraceae bacterium]